MTLTSQILTGDIHSQGSTEVEGTKVKIDSSSGVKVDNAQVIMADIETSNCVIHAIDTVIVPCPG